MQQIVAGLQGHADQDTPLCKAQALMYQAFEVRDEQRRVQLAKDTLAIWPDCADAYVFLAEHARSRKWRCATTNKGSPLVSGGRGRKDAGSGRAALAGHATAEPGARFLRPEPEPYRLNPNPSSRNQNR